MRTASKELVQLEHRFWQSLVEEDADTAIGLLDEPALMVSAHGAMQFDHAAYRKMAGQGPMVIKSFELSDMKVLFPDEDTAVLTYHASQALAARGQSEEIQQEMTDSSVWLRKDGAWRCVMHTETPVEEKTRKH